MLLKIRKYQGYENWVSYRSLRKHLQKNNIKIIDYKGIHLYPFVIPKLNGLLYRLDKKLDKKFFLLMQEFEQIVPIFTNVIFDTSQVHANTVFSHMFAWLDLLLDVIRNHPDTLFVIRAHPDEMRKGKKSRESVKEWVFTTGVGNLKNVVFIPSDGPLSSYDLIRCSKFVIVYNSSIGLEASLLGIPVLCGGKARYTQYPTVFFPKSQDDYRELAEQFLSVEEIDVPPEFLQNARRILYYQFWRSSLLLGDYLEAHPTNKTGLR